LRIQKKKGSCCLNPFESVFVSGNPATTAAPGGGDPPNPLPPGRHQAPRSGIFSGGDHRRAGTRRRGPGYFLAVAPRRLGLPAPCFDHLGGTAAQVVVAYHHLRKAAVPAGGRAVPRHAGRGACAPPRLVAQGRGACEFGRTFRSLQDCGYLDFTLYEIPMIWFRSGVFHRG